MMLLDGKATAQALRAELKDKVDSLQVATDRRPGLAVMLVGEDPASQIYVRNKEKACAEAGIFSETVRLPEETSQEELLRRIDELNARPEVDGVLLQLPVPQHVDSRVCLERIDPDKDVDGFHPMNMGRLVLGLDGLAPCTPAGVMLLLERYGLKPAGKEAVVIGRSNIVGRPLAVMLSGYHPMGHATVTLCHSRTPDLAAHCRKADFVFAAVGKPKLVTRDMVKPGAVVVDVGMNRTEHGLVGDCDFAGLEDVASAMTPVPGGVGPMTIAMLLENTVRAFCKRTGAE